jgi:Na+/proline symporter
MAKKTGYSSEFGLSLAIGIVYFAFYIQKYLQHFYLMDKLFLCGMCILPLVCFITYWKNYFSKK